MSLVAPAGPQDLQAIVAIDGYAASDPQRRQMIEEAIPGSCIVARDAAGAIVGYAVLSRSFFGQAFVELLWVQAEHRRAGHGRAMMRHLVSAHAGRKLFTSTNRSNLPMQALLAAEGFVASGVVDNLDPGDPELVYCHL